MVKSWNLWRLSKKVFHGNQKHKAMKKFHLNYQASAISELNICF